MFEICAYLRNHDTKKLSIPNLLSNTQTYQNGTVELYVDCLLGGTNTCHVCSAGTVLDSEVGIDGWQNYTSVTSVIRQERI